MARARALCVLLLPPSGGDFTNDVLRSDMLLRMPIHVLLLPAST